ncbi:baeRF12 domain-containing protein [Alsobacter metallidurans]|uniref:baeRF12 domain-containing protein n=1 Tax=Alsobacter metallidurans TaxID=340221 RepID=UPI0016632185|nr:host attachment family protein [Alsobacter metallidurans]
MSASKHRPYAPFDSLVLVCDGRKSLFFRNTGSAAAPTLHLMQRSDADPNPPTQKWGADRPGRSGAGDSRRTAMGQTDWHEEAERQFAIETAALLDQLANSFTAKAVVIIAPPRTLSVLRDHVSPNVRAMQMTDCAADLTKHSVPQIEEWLAGEGAT